MSRYFSLFPQTLYTLDNGSNIDLVTNILRRFKFEESLKDDTTLWYEYTLQDGDRPETVAKKYYGDVEKHWIILLLNNIVDVYSQWPLDQDAFNKMLIDKYGSFQVSTQTVYGYYKTITYKDELHGTTNQDTVTITLDAYNALPVQPTVLNQVLQWTDANGKVETIPATITTERSIKYCYDFELETNEAKRLIKLLRKDYVDAVMAEFEHLMEQNV